MTPVTPVTPLFIKQTAEFCPTDPHVYLIYQANAKYTPRPFARILRKCHMLQNATRGMLQQTTYIN